MPDWKEEFERQKDQFSDLVRKASNEELINTLKFGQLTMSNWKNQGIVQTQGVGNLLPPQVMAAVAPVLGDVEMPQPPKTAWDRVLEDEED